MKCKECKTTYYTAIGCLACLFEKEFKGRKGVSKSISLWSTSDGKKVTVECSDGKKKTSITGGKK